MNEIVQWVIVAAIAVAALIYLIKKTKRSATGDCGGCCSGCKFAQDKKCSLLNEEIELK